MLPLSCREETKQTQNCPFMGCQRTFYCFLHFKGTPILLSNAGVLLASGSPLTPKDTFLPGVVSTLHSIVPQHRIQGLKKSVVGFGVFLQNGIVLYKLFDKLPFSVDIWHQFIHIWLFPIVLGKIFSHSPVNEWEYTLTDLGCWQAGVAIVFGVTLIQGCLQFELQ